MSFFGDRSIMCKDYLKYKLVQDQFLEASAFLLCVIYMAGKDDDALK